MSIESQATGIKLVLFDVDGVLTDGRVQIHADGSESKTFGIRDGIAMVWAQRAGIKVGFLSARLSPTTPHRAAQLAKSGLSIRSPRGDADLIAPVVTADQLRGGCELVLVSCKAYDLAEAMEAFAVLRACALAGVPAVELRAVSNAIDEPDRAKWRFDDALAALADALDRLDVV